MMHLSRLLRHMMLIQLILFFTFIQPSFEAPRKPKKSSKPSKSKSNSTKSVHHTKKSNSNDNKNGDKSHKHNNLKKKEKSKSSNSSVRLAVVQKYPKLSEFFSRKPLEFKEPTQLTQCEVNTKREQCQYRTSPKKSHCLRFQNVINELTPYYRPFMSHSRLAGFALHEVRDIQINTCARTVSLTTKPQGNFTLFPNSEYKEEIS